MGHLQGNSPNDITLGTSSYLSRQTLHSSLVDTEKTYSGLTDGCAAAGRVGCKLVEIVGHGASGDDVKNLINDAHDVVKSLPRTVTQLTFFSPQVALQLYRAGYEVPAAPGFLKRTNSELDFHGVWLLTPMAVWLFDIMLTPTIWSGSVNGFLYEYVALVLQASQVYNVTIPGFRKYNVPSGKITLDDAVDNSSPTRVSYSRAAIPASDDFKDTDVTLRDVFGVFVENTRELTPTCVFLTIRPTLFILLTWPSSSRNCLATGVRTIWILDNYVLTTASLDTTRMGGPFGLLSGSLRTVPSSSSTRPFSSEIPFVHSML